ncbi:SIS domain-containing protein [Streptomyces sp. NPDC001508]|uniref:SIS domain-containing protein n=1 Tax=Streptomyces sp. NPDC001508 TaxID=3154656 RepID=UPI00332F8D87
MSINQHAYVAELMKTLAQVTSCQSAAVEKAADLIAESITAGGVLQAFGSGHSEALAMEVSGRAGGLVPTNRLALRDIVLYGGEPADALHATNLERTPEVAHRIYALAPVQPGDVFVIASNSGVNGVVVELARLVKERGHGLIAITSMEHTRRMNSRHPSGQRLYEIADVALDNGAPYGDAVLALPGGGAVCAASSVTAAALAQMVVAEVVDRLIRAGQTPPVYLSSNIPDGDEHNDRLEALYAGRIRRGA